ncbi:hypothetical protein I302_108094 [Kwoniella bestiolae CBS 10118]|uniref:Uncharacterized protein n=1 Tax=Kwoniella bestiolae CBS 10118 TaxID=1296100 RepID=A0A1B9FWP0_9TREE|nr:hypothetical protein I302_07540 [Kwoniella bestiolae CBS 10118]OCF23186.1 hypothetical protein I302_07540 [Kwoniella bestiolae CBS 10118]
MSDSIKEFYKGNSDGMVMVLGSAYYKGSVKLEISDVRTSNTATQDRIGSSRLTSPAVPSAHLLSQELHDTEVLNWNTREIRGAEWHVPTFYNIHKIPHSDLKPTNGSDLSNVGFDEALAQQIMSLEGKEGVHTVQGTVLGVSSLDEGGTQTEAKTTDLDGQSGTDEGPQSEVGSQSWERLSDWENLQIGSATDVESMTTDLEKEKEQSEDGESHHSNETVVSHTQHNESNGKGVWSYFRRSFR